MTAQMAMDLGYQVIMTAFWITLPVLGIGMAIGIVVSIFQAATQIQEASLNFVPKLLGMAVSAVLFGPWIIEKLTGFTTMLITSAASVGGP